MDELGDSVKDIYINENLSKFNKDIAAKCRRLKKKNKISDTKTSYGTVKIKLLNVSKKTIAHKNDLDRLFPDFVYFDD